MSSSNSEILLNSSAVSGAASQVASGLAGVASANPITTAVVLGTAAGAVVLSKIIYDKVTLTKVQPLDKNDQSRYRKLIQANNHYLGLKETPKDWQLIDKKPTITYDFEQIAMELGSQAQILHSHSTPDHHARAIMLSTIASLFTSMNNRSGFVRTVETIAHRANAKKESPIRTDGIEVMFYINLADWLLKIGANLTPKHPETIKQYQHILDYCNKVEKSIITNRRDEIGRNNPHSSLVRLIEIFTCHLTKLHKLQQALNFNDSIQRVDQLILGLASNSLTLLYLLISHVRYPEFLINKFNSPKAEDKKISEARNTEMGEWLYQTLQLVGITNFSSYHTQNILCLEKDVRHHLQYKLSTDKDYKPSKLEFGHRPFAELANTQYPNGKEKALYYASEIRDIHRLIVELYYLSQSQVKASKANENFGAIWIYGNPIGKATLIEFMSSIREVIKELSSKITSFWNEYYTVDFEFYKETYNINTSLDEYAPMLHINETTLPLIQAITEELNQYITNITSKANSYKDDEDSIEQSKIEYISHVLKHRQYKNKILSETYTIAKQGLKELKNFSKRKKMGTASDLTSSALPSGLKRIESYGKVQPISADGNCFFHAIAAELERQGLPYFDHTQLRAKGIAYLKEHPQILKDFPPENMTPKKYLKAMGQLATWAEGPIISALPIELNIYLIIFDLRIENEQESLHIIHSNKPSTDDEALARPIICLVLKNQHYDVLELNEPSAIIKSELPPTTISSSNNTALIHRPTQPLSLEESQVNLYTTIRKLLLVPRYKLVAKVPKQIMEQHHLYFEYVSGKLNYSYLTTPDKITTKTITNKADLDSLDFLGKSQITNEELEKKRRILLHITSKNGDTHPKSIDMLDLEPTINCRPITPAPTKFLSNMQKSIYLQFLQDKAHVVNSWPSFQWSVSRSNHQPFVELYERVNAVMKLLYEPNTTKQPIQSLFSGELLLIDTLLYTTITNAFKKYKFYEFSLNWDAPQLTIQEEEDDKIEIPFSELTVSILHKPLQGMILEAMDYVDNNEKKIIMLQQAAEKSGLELQDKLNDILKLQADIAKMERTLEEKDEIIAGLKQESLDQCSVIRVKDRDMGVLQGTIDGQNITIDEQNITIDGQKKELDDKQSEIDGQKKELDDKQEIIDLQKEDLSIKQSTITQQEGQITNLTAYIVEQNKSLSLQSAELELLRNSLAFLMDELRHKQEQSKSNRNSYTH